MNREAGAEEEVKPPSRYTTAHAYVAGIRDGVDPVTLIREMLNYQIYLEGQHLRLLELWEARK
jgi:hypothetical protein